MELFLTIKIFYYFQKQPPELFYTRCFSQENTTGKTLYQGLFFNKDVGLRLAQMFSCEFWKISKNTFLQNTSGCLFVLPLDDCFYIFDKNLHHRCLTRHSWSSILGFSFLHQRFERTNFNYGNSIFKFRPKNTKIRHFCS